MRATRTCRSRAPTAGPSTRPCRTRSATSNRSGSTTYPKVSGGKTLTPLKGGLYSVDGLQVAETGQLSGPIKDNACAQKDTAFVVDNGAFCTLDDSIAWDRAPTHLFAQLAAAVRRPLMVALIFAHEFGHAISYRLGIFDTATCRRSTPSRRPTAPPAPGPHRRSRARTRTFATSTAAKLDDALEGFLNGRDSTPNTPTTSRTATASTGCRPRRRHRQGRVVLLLVGLLRLPHVHRAAVHQRAGRLPTRAATNRSPTSSRRRTTHSSPT